MPRRTVVDPQFPVLLKTLRTRRKMSHSALGRAAAVGSSYLSELENGLKNPGVEVAAALDRALGADGELAGMVTEPERHGGTRLAAHGKTGSTAEPSPLQAAAAEAFMAHPIGQVGMPHGTLMRRPHGHVLAASSLAHLDEIVVHLREQWHALVRTDNLLGPRFAIAGVLNQIVVIEELCFGLRGEQRREVVRLGAQYAESAAWLYEDAGNIAQARYWTSRAMELAHEGDDARMLAWTIFRRSQQAATALEVARAIGLAQAALRNEEQLATPTRAAIRVQEAYGHALDGNELAAHTLLDEAHTWAASDNAGDAHEGHGSYCTSSYIEIQRANCWLTNGNPRKAVALYENALATLPVVYQRGRAAALARLAVAYVSVGQLEQAAHAAHAALPVARSGGSMRIVDEVEGIGRQLASYRRLQGVAVLLDALGIDGER